jgi:hypothetical protein
VIFDVYGFGEPSLGNEPDRLAEALGVVWQKYDSEYRGVTFTARQAGGKLRLQSNDLHDDGGDYHQLPDFPEYRYLLFVDKFRDPDDVRVRLAPLPQWRFLYRSVVD